MSPSQGLPDEHSPLEGDDEIVLGARVEDVVAVDGLYSDAKFFTSAITGEKGFRLSTGVVYSETAVAPGVVGVRVEKDSGQPYAENEEVGDVGCARMEAKTVLTP
jgi:hypothetical protein